MKRKGIIIVVSGFSGAGKGTIMKELTRKYDQYALSISATTRKPREGEENGREYFFISKEEFEKLIEEDGLIEHARYVDNYYGTPRKYVEDKLSQGIDVILEIEIQGALQIKERYNDAVLLFVMPPSAKVLEERLPRANEEAIGIENYDYIVINDNLQDSVECVHEIISAAHLSPARNQEFINTIRKELGELN